MGPIALTGAAIVAIAALAAGRLPLANDSARTLERTLQLVSFAGITLAIGHVVVLLATEDTSYAIVVDHTRPGLGIVRRVMGLWGGSEGSLLFFAFVIGGVLIAAPTSHRMRVAPSIVLVGLTAASSLAASPFERLDAPAVAGSGLSPILEHWAMIIHPPLLYVGLALSLLPAIVSPSASRRFAMVAISVLTVALTLGGAWAYVELGWGGWYAWDPVENAALLPWLLLVTGIHVGPTHVVARWTSALVWPTVFCGTAMTRTSLRTSVHSFANSEELGWYLWPLAAVASAGALAAAATPDLSHTPSNATVGRRLMPLIVIGYSAVVVSLGTFRPFLPGDATNGTFYSRFLFPAVIAGLLGLGIAPRPRAPVGRLTIEVVVGGVVGAALGAAVGWVDWWQLTFAAALGASVATTIGGELRPSPRLIAHLGMIFVLAGTLGGTASTSQTFALEAGERIEIGGHIIVNDGIEFAEGPPPVITANVLVDGQLQRPALTIYPERALRLPEVSTRRTLHEDVQLVIRNADDDGSVVLTANIEPLTQLVWLGAALLAIAGLAGSRYSDRFSRRAFSNSLTVDDASDGVLG